jgi:GNAT superfamily N-acetyltransferase
MTAAIFDRTTSLLGAEDVERVISIDRAYSGRERRHFFERRFAAATARPADYIHIGIVHAGALRGFVIARVFEGEFGRKRPVVVLDAIGVEGESREHGIGRALMEELFRALRERGESLVQSQVDWTNHDLLRFFAASGFRIAPRLVLERSVSDSMDESIQEV